MKSSEIAMCVRPEIQAWLRANDIDPDVVPLGHVPMILDGRITCLVFLLDEAGRKYLVDDELAVEILVVPLKVKPPAALSQWLNSEEG